MEKVYLLWMLDEQSWTNTIRKFKGVFRTVEAAVKEIPDWAKESSYAKRFPGKYGADGISYEIELQEVKG